MMLSNKSLDSLKENCIYTYTLILYYTYMLYLIKAFDDVDSTTHRYFSYPGLPYHKTFYFDVKLPAVLKLLSN